MMAGDAWWPVTEESVAGWMQLQLGRCYQEASDLRRLVSREVVEDDVDLAAARLCGEQFFEQGHESSLVCRWTVLPWTSPLRVSRAA